MGGQNTEIIPDTYEKASSIGTVRINNQEHVVWQNDYSFEIYAFLPEGYELCPKCRGRKSIKIIDWNNNHSNTYLNCLKCNSTGVISWVDKILK